MGGRKKKKKRTVIFCYYCDRHFDNEKVLIEHQRGKHFKCPICHRRLSSARGMMIHVFQVHKESIDAVPHAKKGRDSFELEIFGMVGVPPELVQEKQVKIYGEPVAKKQKLSHIQLPGIGGGQQQMFTQMGMPMVMNMPMRPMGNFAPMGHQQHMQQQGMHRGPPGGMQHGAPINQRRQPGGPGMMPMQGQPRPGQQPQHRGGHPQFNQHPPPHHQQNQHPHQQFHPPGPHGGMHQPQMRPPPHQQQQGFPPQMMQQQQHPQMMQPQQPPFPQPGMMPPQQPPPQQTPISDAAKADIVPRQDELVLQASAQKKTSKKKIVRIYDKPTICMEEIRSAHPKYQTVQQVAMAAYN